MTTKRFVAKFGLDNNNQTITNVASPVNSTDVATKSITDDVQAFAQSGFSAANTAASNTVYLQSVSNFSNTRILGVENSVVYLQGVTNQINVSAAFANTWLQSNDALTLSVSKTYTDNSNTQLKTYSDATFYTKTGGSISGPVTITSNLLVTGNLTVSGNVTTVSANNLVLKDNMIYLNEGATGNANPDIGISGAYNDGIYHHAGFFRDHATGTWKVFDNYQPEPDASPWIDQSNSSFRIANFQANTVTFGSLLSTSNVLIQGPLVISANTSMTVPVGNTAQRPTGTNGMLRYNADTGSFEGYTVSGWGSIGGAIYMANTPPNNPQNGSTWWNTDAGKLLIYYTDVDSSQWVDASPDQAGLLARPVRQTFIATSGQSAFTVTGGYTPGLVDVFLNGTKLVNGTDVTVTSGSNVILASGAIIGSTLEVVGLNATSLTNVLPITGGTLTGDLQLPNLTYTGTLTGSANVVNIGSGQIYKDTSGNVGIGTSSPQAKLHVQSTDGAPNASGNMTYGSIFTYNPGGLGLQIGNNSVGGYNWINSAYTNNSGVSAPLAFFTGAAERMRLDSSGNLGLGVTPLSSGTTAFEVKGGGDIGFQGNGNINANAYYSSGSYKYVTSSTAVRYNMNGASAGGHAWYTAPSGTAGNVISFTQAMTLSSNVCLGIGDTSPTTTLSIIASPSIASGDDYAKSIKTRFGSSSTYNAAATNSFNRIVSGIDVGWYSDKWTIGVTRGGATDIEALVFARNSSEKMVLDTNGNLLVGTTSVTEGGKFSLVGVKSLVAGIPQGQITVSDSTALAAGVGGAINFAGIYTSGGSVTSFASVEGYKENATSGDYAGAMVFKTRTNGGSQTERARIDSSGNLLIGTTSGGAVVLADKMVIQRDITATGDWSVRSIVRNTTANKAVFLGIYNTVPGIFAHNGTLNAWNDLFLNTTNGSGGGNVYVELGTGTLYTSSGRLTNTNPSDSRLKEDVKEINYGLNEINKLNPVTFKFKNDAEDKKDLRWGFIAQEVQPIMPELVTTFTQDGEEYFGLEQNGVYTVLVKAVQELHSMNMELTARIEALENK